MSVTVAQANSQSASSPLESFRRDGYAIFRDVVDTGLVSEASAHVEWLQARHPEVRPENLDHQLLGKDPFWLRLVSDSRLLDIAELFIGRNIALFASHYICKPPRDGQPVLWHQDGSYWPLEPMEVVSLWLAVDDSTPENGCMRVIPGTQHLDLQQLKARTEIANVLRSGMDDAAVDLIRLGTPLHDIGKIGIDDAILRKPGKLTTVEYEAMKTRLSELGLTHMTLALQPKSRHRSAP